MNTPNITPEIEAHRRGLTYDLVTQVRRFLLYFLEFQFLMGLGALICYLLGLLIPASSSFTAVYHPGTYLFAIGDVLFLTFPVVTWMIIRGHDWRFGLEMAFTMIAPVVVIAVLGQQAGFAYLRWLITGMYPVMSLGMLGYMLYRRNYFTARAFRWMPTARLERS